jgi:ATP-dependent helicase/nuclease subunit A
MAEPVLENDSSLNLPHFTLLKASAGSGKTYQLSLRFVQYLLSDKIQRNGLRNIVAMTFSNNAAKEMKGRILDRLKLLSLGDEKKLAEMSALLSILPEEIMAGASKTLDAILDQYSDFQVRTIDSFMTTLFKASALDFGYQPEFEIKMDNSQTIKYAFNRFMLRVAEGLSEAARMEAVVGLISGQKKSDSAYMWDPSSSLLEEMKKLYRISSMRGKKLVIPDMTARLRACGSKMNNILEDIEKAIEQSGLARNRASSYTRSNILQVAREGRFPDLVGKQFKTAPVNQVKDKKLAAAHQSVCDLWTDFVGLAHEYSALYAQAYFHPYLSVFEPVNEEIEDVKRRQGVIFIEDVNRCLASYLDLSIVPDIYFGLGETISHFLIDEFQDTSPIQWSNLFPLLENTLAGCGSFFAVGDTKQAIYSFREADYRIMKSIEKENPFLSASFNMRELGTNRRSCPEILKFNETVFKQIVASSEDYGSAARESGLDEYTQKANPECKLTGYVELSRVIKEDNGGAEKERLCGIIDSLLERQYRCGDIAILTSRNEDAVRVTSWLNDHKTPFISFSSLDIRRRRLTGEIVSLLRFLDSPTDNLSFATFILGDIFARTLAADNINGFDPHSFLSSTEPGRPVYKLFQKGHADLWDGYFSDLFRCAGYFPLYDLLTQAYHKFRLFDIFGEEEATLIRLLETAKDFEGQGFNNLANFLDFADDLEAEETEWHMKVPETQDAVRVMTIHKAKGLGFPVVIILLYERKSRGFEYIVREEEESFSILKITKDIAAVDTGLEALYQAEELKEDVNGLNSLYVGFTRPEQELYVIGVAADAEKNAYPLQLLPFSAYRQGARPARQAPEETEAASDVRLTHRHEEIVFPAPAGSGLNLREKQRGDLIHAVLANIRFMDGTPESAVREAIKPMEKLGRILDDVNAALESFLAQPDIAEYFSTKQGRTVWSEKEVVDSTGRLFRIDRLVIDPDKITIMDFKTGGEEDDEGRHLPQMKNYMQIVRGIYPSHVVSGVIAYVDQLKLRRIS